MDKKEGRCDGCKKRTSEELSLVVKTSAGRTEAREVCAGCLIHHLDDDWKKMKKVKLDIIQMRRVI